MGTALIPWEKTVRTNNLVEKREVGFNRFVGKSHPNVYEFISHPKKALRAKAIHIKQSKIGKDVSRSNTVYRRLGVYR